jgi:dethiobiotin synthetase
MGRIVCITGSDTGVGKTWVTAALARGLRDAGIKVSAIKPVESGVAETLQEDGVVLAQATGQTQIRSALTRLQQAVAPPLAAASEGIALRPEAWLSTIREMAQCHELVLVEGAGGLLSPLTWSFDLLDIIKSCAADTIVVARNKLGVMNHVRLTVEVLQGAGLSVIAIVLTPPADEDGGEDSSTGSNEASIARFYPSLKVISVPAVATWSEQTAYLTPLMEVLGA